MSSSGVYLNIDKNIIDRLIILKRERNVRCYVETDLKVNNTSYIIVIDFNKLIFFKKCDKFYSFLFTFAFIPFSLSPSF